MSFVELRNILHDIIDDADRNSPSGENKMLNWIIEETMENFWDWLDALPANEKTVSAKATVKNYITGYLHDLEESQTVEKKEVCRLCGFNVEKAEKRGRQWAQSVEIYDGVWICGYCKDAIQELE